MKKPRVLSTTPAAGVKVQLVVAAAALVTVYYRMPLPFLLLILYLFYLVWSYYWTLMSCRSTVGESSAAPVNIFAGETFSRDFRFYNGWLFPLVRCGISFLLPARLTCSSDVPIAISKLSGDSDIDSATTLQVFPVWNSCTVFYAWLPEKKEITVRLQFKAASRGIYYLPPPCLFVGDPSGLFRGMNQVGREQHLYVFPRLESAGDIFKTLDLQENNREDSFGLEDRYQAQGVRDYQMSDSPKSINWYATARANSLKTNIYQRKDSEFCLVVLDLSAAGQSIYADNSARLEDPSLEKAISLAAGIALFHLEQGAMTAFFTNAPTLRWEISDSGPRPDRAGAYMKRISQITALDFAGGTPQAQKILKLCASIDETNRAKPEAQQKLWSLIQKIPANTLIYLLAYHDPPQNWLNTEENSDHASHDPAGFYSPQKLAGLASSRVRLINLSKGRGPK